VARNESGHPDPGLLFEFDISTVSEGIARNLKVQLEK
jgi:hypothetical protein